MFDMKAHLINTHLLVPRSRSSANVKVKYKGYISQKMAVSGTFMFHKHILFCMESLSKNADFIHMYEILIHRYIGFPWLQQFCVML